MFFNKQKSAEKKNIKAEVKLEEQKAQELSQEITRLQKEKQDAPGALTKDLRSLEPQESGFFSGLKKGLAKTKGIFTNSILSLSSEDKADEAFLEDLEERLLSADLGVGTSLKILEHLREEVGLGKIRTQSQAISTLKVLVANILDLGSKPLPVAVAGPTVYLFVGVNGVGKTTSIGKLAAQYKAQGKKVLVAAGDTFRAAAIEQLVHWCEQVGVDCMAKTQGSDPSATFFEAATRAKEGGYDILLCDTSGRLHNKKHLMDELSKMVRSLKKVLPTAPHASLLVLDANTGQNAIAQTREFSEVIGLDGLIITKLDGTAKGGVIIGIVNEFEKPVYFVGVGERVEDLLTFSAQEFAQGLLG